MKRENLPQPKTATFFVHNAISEQHSPYSAVESDLMLLLVSRLIAGVLTYRFSVRELLDVLNISDSNYKELIEAMKGLRSKYYSISYVNEQKEKRRADINVIGHIDWPDNDSTAVNLSSYIDLSISSTIAPFLFDLKNNFTAGGLQEYLQLQGKTAKKMFLLLLRWKETGFMVKTVDDLQKIFGTDYEFKHFNSKIIKNSITQISAKSKIFSNIEVVLKRKGRSIETVYFYFDHTEPIRTQQLQISLPPDMGPDKLLLYDSLITKHRLTNRQAIIVMEHVPLAGIRTLLGRVQRSEYKNIDSYTIGAFRKEYGLSL